MPFLEFLAGSISGALGVVVGYPADTVKVRLQAQSEYKGIFHCIAKTYTHEGLHGFFKGMAFPLLSTGIINSIVFGAYSNALDYMSQSQCSHHAEAKAASAAQVFTAGCFSGLIQVVSKQKTCVKRFPQKKKKGQESRIPQTFVSAPIDLVKVRLQGQTVADRYKGAIHCVAVILREDGPRGLFRGALALGMRDIPCYGLYFLPYEIMIKALTESGKEPGTFAILMAGGIAGTVTWATATPMDVVKARLQMSGAGGREYSGLLHCIRESTREEGLKVFFKGLLLNSLRAFPVNAIIFLSYESIMKVFCHPAR
ncbi:solute carrier family 25 member 45 isoform X1 [Antennarius striatus]|uniref:solute carrier family 25 member 45 isoform X1 n=1 Tax=Antennarius striatus TaxID=241820 RepID=UPI0035B0C433